MQYNITPGPSVRAV